MAVAVVGLVNGFGSVAAGVPWLDEGAVELIASRPLLSGDSCSAGGLVDGEADRFEGMPDFLGGGVLHSIQLRIGRVCIDLPRLIGRVTLTLLVAWAVFVAVASFLSVSNDPILPGAAA